MLSQTADEVDGDDELALYEEGDAEAVRSKTTNNSISNIADQRFVSEFFSIINITNMQFNNWNF